MDGKHKTLGLDPGKMHYAWALIGPRGKLLRAGFFLKTVTSLARAEQPQLLACLAALDEMVRESGAKEVAVEQFAARQFGTSLSQYINIMQGMLVASCRDAGVTLHSVMPSTWKNYVRKLGDLEALYKHAKSMRVPPHVVDAICIGIFVRRNFRFLPADKRVIEQCVASAAKMASVTDGLPVRPKPKRRKKRVRKDKLLGAQSARKGPVPSGRGGARARKRA